LRVLLFFFWNKPTNRPLPLKGFRPTLRIRRWVFLFFFWSMAPFSHVFFFTQPSFPLFGWPLPIPRSVLPKIGFFLFVCSKTLRQTCKQMALVFLPTICPPSYPGRVDKVASRNGEPEPVGIPPLGCPPRLLVLPPISQSCADLAQTHFFAFLSCEPPPLPCCIMLPCPPSGRSSVDPPSQRFFSIAFSFRPWWT